MKAFDRLEWSFLWLVLEVMGFGNTFMGMIKAMYSNSSARVLTGHTFSSLGEGAIRQAIRQSTMLSPICICNTQHHLSLFADDVMVFIDNPSQSPSQLLSLCEEYRSLSAFKINWCN